MGCGHSNSSSNSYSKKRSATHCVDRFLEARSTMCGWEGYKIIMITRDKTLDTNSLERSKPIIPSCYHSQGVDLELDIRK